MTPDVNITVATWRAMARSQCYSARPIRPEEIVFCVAITFPPRVVWRAGAAASHPAPDERGNIQ